MPDTPEWLSVRQLADLIGVSVHTIYAWRYDDPPQGPRAHKIGKHIRFRRADVETWLTAQAEDTAASA